MSTMSQLRPAHELIREKIGKRISPQTLWRWIHRGCNGVRLNVTRVGCTVYLTESDWQTFIGGQNPAPVVSAARDQSTHLESTARRLTSAGLA